MFSALLLLSCGAESEPQFEVTNKMPAFTVVNKVPSDPYAADDYWDFYARVQAGGSGVLVVGIADKYVGGYQLHLRVSSGFRGWKDGEYEFTQDGVRLLKGVSQTATPKEPGSTEAYTRATPAQSATTPLQPGRVLGSSVATPGSITNTLVPSASGRAILLGGYTSNCPPSG